MRQRRTDFRLWAAIAFVLFAAYLGWDYFTDRNGIVVEALDRIDKPKLFLRGVGMDRCVLPCLISAVIATVLGWMAQRVAIRLGFGLGRAPDSTLIADFDDKSTNDPA